MTCYNNNKLVFTNSHADLSWRAISSTVTGHHTDVVVLVMLQRQVDGSIGSDEGRLGFVIVD